MDARFNGPIAGASVELGKLIGVTTAAARERLDADPAALDELINRAIDPEKKELVAVQQELRQRLEERQAAQKANEDAAAAEADGETAEGSDETNPASGETEGGPGKKKRGKKN